MEQNVQNLENVRLRARILPFPTQASQIQQARSAKSFLVDPVFCGSKVFWERRQESRARQQGADRRKSERRRKARESTALAEKART